MYRKASDYLKKKFEIFPETAIILGTGLNSIAKDVKNSTIIRYSDIPEFPVSTVDGHIGELIVGELHSSPIAFLSGRTHYYEGYTMNQLAIPIQALCSLGVKTLIITNASGGINESFNPGDIVMITDHIKLCADSPLRGINPSELGDRFFNMTNAYNHKLQKIAISASERCCVSLKSGIYAYMSGPQFETPAEIHMLRLLGADLVGMSTVSEVITAVHCGIKVLALSCVTNMAAGMENGGLNRSVIENSEKIGVKKMAKIIKELLKEDIING